jgi:hypothetical protein
MIDFNINNFVYVKLTQRGRDILRANHDNHAKISEYEPPKEDSEGWSKWQMWELFANFGHHWYLGMDVPFETTIRIDNSLR